MLTQPKEINKVENKNKDNSKMTNSKSIKIRLNINLQRKNDTLFIKKVW